MAARGRILFREGSLLEKKMSPEGVCQGLLLEYLDGT